MVALLWRRTMVAPRRAVPKDEARRIAANIAKPPELLQLNGVKLVIAGRRSYPTFPPPLRVSYSIQIPKTIRLKYKDTGRFQAPAPQRPCGIRAYKTPARPSWGLFHLRLASSPVSASASEWSNCSECLFRLAQGANEGLSGSLYNGGQDGSVCPIPKR